MTPRTLKRSLFVVLAVVVVAWMPLQIWLHGSNELVDRVELLGGQFMLWCLLLPVLVVTANLISALTRWPAKRREAAWRRRVLNRHCALCGYDVRATPDRCPECGGVPTDGWA